jgi:ATP-dependent Clp protease ATP-binding subunit ClpA
VAYEAREPFGFHGAGDAAASGPEVDADAVYAELRRRLEVGDEFIARVTHTFVFRSMTRAAIRSVLQMQRLKALAAARGFELTWDEDLLAHLIEQWQPRFGVRYLTAVLNNRVTEQLSLAEAHGKLRGVGRIHLRLATAGKGPGNAERRREGDALSIHLA